MFNDVSLIMIAVAVAVVFLFGVGGTLKFLGWRKNKADKA